MGKINIHQITIKNDENDSTPVILIVIDDTVVLEGTWMSLIEAQIQGFVYGLEIANYEVNKIEYEVIVPGLKDDYTLTQLFEHVKRHKS